jgi:serine/threonine protein kinase
VYFEVKSNGQSRGASFLHIQDSSPGQVWPFGELKDKFAWLWTQRGQLQVVKTPFWPGRHEAKWPAEFLPVVEELQDLHAQGLVHGDIRCFNIIFNGDKGKLIDFDYSGKAGGTYYPYGYVQLLSDGARPSTEGRVEMWHDWLAIGYIIFSLHRLVPPEEINAELKYKFLDEWVSLKESFKGISSNEEVAVQISNLIRLLQECQKAGYSCESDNAFQILMGNTNIKYATGSLAQRPPFRSTVNFSFYRP